jgi:hypothetical protein
MSVAKHTLAAHGDRQIVSAAVEHVRNQTPENMKNTRHRRITDFRLNDQPGSTINIQIYLNIYSIESTKTWYYIRSDIIFDYYVDRLPGGTHQKKRTSGHISYYDVRIT